MFFSLKALLPLSAVFISLTDAAFPDVCGKDVHKFAIQDLRDFRSIIQARRYKSFTLLSLSTGAKSDAQGNKNSQNDEIVMDNLRFCIKNEYHFHSTTVYPDEIAELLQEYVNCHLTVTAGGGRTDKPTHGELFGDTGLNVLAYLDYIFIGNACR